MRKGGAFHDPGDVMQWLGMLGRAPAVSHMAPAGWFQDGEALAVVGWVESSVRAGGQDAGSRWEFHHGKLRSRRFPGSYPTAWRPLKPDPVAT